MEGRRHSKWRCIAVFCLTLASAVAALSPPAWAGHVGINIDLGLPFYVAPQPIYVARPPVVVMAPPPPPVPVVVQGPPVVVYPDGYYRRLPPGHAKRYYHHGRRHHHYDD